MIQARKRNWVKGTRIRIQYKDAVLPVDPSFGHKEQVSSFGPFYALNC